MIVKTDCETDGSFYSTNTDYVFTPAPAGQSEAAGPVSCKSSAAASCRCVSKLRVRVLAPDLVVKINQGQWLLLLGSDFNKSGRQGGDEIIQTYLMCPWLIILVKQ